jgi:hypothetical protein
MNKTINFFVLCFPHFGTLDNWMPIVDGISTSSDHLKFTLIIPDANIVRSFHKDNAVVKISNNIFDTVLIYAYDDIWIEQSSVFNSITWYKKNQTTLRLIDILKSLTSRSLFFYILRWLLILLQNKVYGKELKVRCKNFKKSTSYANTLLYDIHAENNFLIKDVLQLFEEGDKYSLPHALSMLTFGKKASKPVSTFINNKDDITVYVYAEFQSKYYNLKYGVDPDKVHVVGIPRHDLEWIKVVKNESDNLPSDFNNSDTVIILSRHVSKAHLLFDEKMESVKNIKKLFIDNLGMKVVIKAHPNEVQEKLSISGKENIYEDVFGLDNYGVTWMYSNLHAFALGKGKRIVISFNTGIVFDFIAMGVPCVEYIELVDNSEKNITQFSENGFIERVSNYQELRYFSDRCFDHSDKILASSASAYKNYFPVFGNISKSIATEILNDINSK